MKSSSSADPVRDLKLRIKRLDLVIAKRPTQISRLAKPLRAGAERQLEKDRLLREELQKQLDALEQASGAPADES
jgi:hypothetical protein